MSAATDEQPLHVTRYYGELPIREPETFVRKARKALRGVDFDTIVATGMSGLPAAALLGRSLRKNVLLVRKPDDKDNHHGGPVIGVLGRRWIFVDDFVSSGETYRRVAGKVQELSHGDAVLVGRYCYGGYASAGWTPAAEESKCIAYNPLRPVLEGINIG